MIPIGIIRQEVETPFYGMRAMSLHDAKELTSAQVLSGTVFQQVQVQVYSINSLIWVNVSRNDIRCFADMRMDKYGVFHQISHPIRNGFMLGLQVGAYLATNLNLSEQQAQELEVKTVSGITGRKLRVMSPTGIRVIDMREIGIPYYDRTFIIGYDEQENILYVMDRYLNEEVFNDPENPIG